MPTCASCSSRTTPSSSGRSSAGLEREGYVVDAAESGDVALALAAATDYDGDRARPHAARDRRLLGVPALRQRRALDAGADADRARPTSTTGSAASTPAPTTTSSSRSTSASSSRGCAPCCAAGPSSAPRCWRSATCAIDPATRVVTRAGQEIELTAREYDVLEFLARRPGASSRARSCSSESGRTTRARRTSSTSTSATCARSSEPAARSSAPSAASGFVLEALVRLPIRARLTAWYIAVLTAIIGGARRRSSSCSSAPTCAPRSTATCATRWRPLARQYAAGGLQDFAATAAPSCRATAADQVFDSGGRLLATLGRRRRRTASSRRPRRGRRRARRPARAWSTVALGRGAASSYRAVIGPSTASAQRHVLAVAEPFQPVEDSVAAGADAPAAHGARRARRGRRRRLVARAQGPAAGRADDVEGRADRHRPARRADRGAPRLRRARASGRDAQRDARPPAARRRREAAPGRRRLARAAHAARRDARGARREPARRPHAGGARGARERARGGRPDEPDGRQPAHARAGRRGPAPAAHRAAACCATGSEPRSGRSRPPPPRRGSRSRSARRSSRAGRISSTPTRTASTRCS